jgi:serine O-acetyltransferase
MNYFINIRNDLTTYNGQWGSQGFWAMVIYRFGNWRYGIRPVVLRKAFSLLYRILFKCIQIITGIELPCEVRIGNNFRIDHFGGIIISGYARFGDNCVLRNGVTIGLKNVEEKAAPEIGNNVSIGAGATILGPITIGDNVNIGAGAVVIQSVPDNCLAVGVPATVKKIQ